MRFRITQDFIGQTYMIDHFPLPIQGKPERRHLYRWIRGEEEYVHGKFDDQRAGHDQALRDGNMEDFWTRQIVQYLDRAHAYLKEAEGCDPEHARQLQMLAQQAICKCMMTVKGCAESSIRVFGPLPLYGSSTKGALPWETGAILLEREIEARG